MKFFLTLVCLISATCANAQTDISGLSSHVSELVRSYHGTAEPMLPEPDHESWSELDSPFSVAPGRMRVTKQIVVDKPNTRLYIINAFGDTLGIYRVCASLKKGQKMKADDWRTPEGTFKVMGVYNSTDWGAGGVFRG